MNIYKVYVDETTQGQWNGNWYDEYFGHVVVAESKEEAIELAYEIGMIVPRELVTVEIISIENKGVVLSDFNAG